MRPMISRSNRILTKNETFSMKANVTWIATDSAVSPVPSGANLNVHFEDEFARMAKLDNAADCKSAIRGFESLSAL